MPEARSIDTISKLATTLETGLQKNEIQSIIALLENGVHPDALAALILELRRAGVPTNLN
jgi:hypothetical protein